ncbi:cbb3-type cytochrome oxidase assembly protein CcoS [Mesorhizobium sp.]|uniref:cbb3-type cytochrome oxidase assembly protein CcoS n=1 Tax=Mesorhizobium sp. TaxID=1871066 RepID=UPI000FE7E05A|nr:cbb3-type cytochrome oxidase assembly protein CcoS [Mesorhizobium sp.]RWO22613.1 MAG: cbb3-type cytochrome oxidase assembly protein CcoS [Mesorhizobium sp.]
MNYLVWLVPIALGMGVAGLAAFLWSMRSGQYEDLDGAAERVLVSDAADVPLRQYGWKSEAAAHEARPKGGKAPTADGVFLRSRTDGRV